MTIEPLTLIALVAGTLLVSVLAAVIAARLTLRAATAQFTSERWWERKADAYSGLVHALHAMRGYVQNLQDVHAGHPAPMAEEHLKVQWRHGREELARAAARASSSRPWRHCTFRCSSAIAAGWPAWRSCRVCT